jgi:hypothetical protein
MQVLQAGTHKLIYLELQPDMVTSIARQVGFETRAKDTARVPQLDLTARAAGNRRCRCSPPPIRPTWDGRAANSTSEANAAYGHRLINLADGWVAGGGSEGVAGKTACLGPPVIYYGIYQEQVYAAHRKIVSQWPKSRRPAAGGIPV